MITLYNKILQALKNCSFEQFNDQMDITEELDPLFFQKGNWDFGATKMVLYPTDPTLKIVVKIPFEGQWNSGEIYNADTDEWEDKEFFNYFENADAGEKWNYCEAEIRLYEEAEAEDIEHFFLPNQFVGHVHGHPIYVQEEVVCFESRKSNKIYSDEIRERTKEICSNHNIYCFHTPWISDFLDYYGEDDLVRLDEFLHRQGIHDLHSGNLGYTSAGIPIILDYGGFNE